MRIVEISISNIGCIEELILKPRALTVLSGGNGVGKTSALLAARLVVEGGHDPSVIRVGAKKGEVLWVLDTGATIKRTVTAKSSTLLVTDPEGNPVPKPQAYVEQLAAGFSFNPLGLMTASKKERAAFLLSAMPTEFDYEEVAGALKEIEGITLPGSIDLDGLAAARKLVYERRTECSRATKQADYTVITLRRALPEEDGNDWEEKSAEASEELGKARAEVEKKKRALGQVLAGEFARIEGDQTEEFEAVRRKYEEQREEARKLHYAEEQNVEMESAARVSELSGLVSEYREKASAQKKAAGARETIEKMSQQARDGSHQEMRLTRAIEKLDELRAAKLATLPIPGVEIRDGEVFVGDIPFERLNTAKQFEISFQLAALKTGELGFMIADRAESLDEETWAGFNEAANKSGYQVLAARVSTGPLEVSAA